MEKKENKTTVVTRAEKKENVKNLVKEVLTKKEYKHNDLIETVANLYAERYESEAENMNDVKGRVGSVLDIMKKEREVSYEGGAYALTAKKAEVKAEEPAEEKPKKQTRKKSKKEEPTEEKIEEVKSEEKPKKTARAKKAKEVKAEEVKTEEKVEEGKGTPMPPAPLQPIAPTAPVTPEIAPEPIPEKKPRRTRKKAQAEEQIAVAAEVKTEEKVEEKEEVKEIQEVKEEKAQTALTEVKKGEIAKKPTVMDMSFLFGSPKTPKAEPSGQEKIEAPVQEQAKEQPKEQPKEEKKEPISQAKAEEKREEKKEERREYPTKQARPQQPQQPKQSNTRKIQLKKTVKVMTADERLKEAFLKKIRSLGGDYFEYYSVYLLEKYSRQNGRRLEGLRITAGDHDGGIDGEIELTDKLGFRETIYIQSKNWNPEKGDERLWIVGETLLQQFIGACACRQAKDGKQHCRGIFITTSRFTPEAKRILENMSDKIVGYDGEDLFETAKECSFGLIKKNGEWALDENLLSGEKAFFSML